MQLPLETASKVYNLSTDAEVDTCGSQMLKAEGLPRWPVRLSCQNELVWSLNKVYEHFILDPKWIRH